MIPAKKVKILNAQGSPIVLTRREQMLCNMLQKEINQKFKNDLGYEISITTLTSISKKISEQKFFEVAPADFLPVRVGEGAFSSNLTTYRTYDLAGDFETGMINTGSQGTRQAINSTGVDSLNIKIYNWVKTIGWTIFDLEEAAKSGNWDLVSSLEESRKRNWDLGIQRVAFLGARGLNSAGGSCLGLLNQSGITNNTSVITKPISEMSTTELKAFTAAVYEAYRENCARTAKPTHFILPESDYNGLASPASPDFPVKSTLELLLEMFRTITGNKQFQILPLAYGDAQYHSDVSSIVGKQVYVMLNYDEKSIRMDIPVDYTNTLANSLNNFDFQNSAYGQFTGVLAYRPLELLYFTFSA